MRFLGGVFTRQERLALGFLLGVGLAGMAVEFLRREHRPDGFSAPPAAVTVNRAGEADLVALPGVGPVLAERILKDRALHGRFLTLKDLARVKGVTPKTLEKIRGLVRFD